MLSGRLNVTPLMVLVIFASGSVAITPIVYFKAKVSVLEQNQARLVEDVNARTAELARGQDEMMGRIVKSDRASEDASLKAEYLRDQIAKAHREHTEILRTVKANHAEAMKVLRLYEGGP